MKRNINRQNLFSHPFTRYLHVHVWKFVRGLPDDDWLYPSSPITGTQWRLTSPASHWFRRRWKHQSSAPLAFVRGIHQWPVDSPHKGPVMREMFPFDDVIMPPKHRRLLSFAIKYHMNILKTRNQFHGWWWPRGVTTKASARMALTCIHFPWNFWALQAFFLLECKRPLYLTSRLSGLAITHYMSIFVPQIIFKFKSRMIVANISEFWSILSLKS